MGIEAVKAVKKRGGCKPSAAFFARNEAAPAAFFARSVQRQPCGCPDCRAERRLQRNPLIGDAADRQEEEAERLADAAVGGGVGTAEPDAMAPPDQPPADGEAQGQGDGALGGGAAGSLGGGDEEVAFRELPRVRARRANPERPAPELEGDILAPLPVEEKEAGPEPQNFSDEVAGDDPPQRSGEAMRAQLDARAGQGHPLPLNTLAFFEDHFGRSLQGVRLHTDGEANALAAGLHAQAFAYGQDIYFGAGRYAPDTHSGRHLMAHELVHTIQQSTAATRRPAVQRQPEIDNIRNPPESALTVRLSGLTFSPVNGQWSAGSRVPQAFAVILKRLTGPGYRPDMVQRFQAWSAGSPDVSGALAVEGEAPMGTFHVLGIIPFQLMTFVETAAGSSTSLQLTEAQKRLIRVGRQTDIAWEAIASLVRYGLVRALPGWFTRELFFSQMASRVALLDSFSEAYASLEQGRTPDRLRVVTDRASDIVHSIAEQTDVVEAVRTDQRLINRLGYKLVWPPAAVNPNESLGDRMQRSRTAVAPADPGAAQISNLNRLLDYVRAQPALARRSVGSDAADASAARQALLERFERFLVHVLPDGPGDQQLSASPGRLATHPPHPSRLSVHPALEPPFFDAATGTEHHFTMSLLFPSVFDAFQSYTYRFALFRVPDDQVIGAAGAAQQTQPAPPVQRPSGQSQPAPPVQRPSTQPAPSPPVQRPSARETVPAGPAGGRPSVEATPEGTERVAHPTGTVLRTRLARDARYLRADLVTVINDMDVRFGPPGTSVGLVALGGLLRFTGTLIRSLLERIFEPAYSTQFVFEREGLHLVRAIAFPHSSDEAEVTRPPSVAYLPVFARDPEVMAEARVQAQVEREERAAARQREIEAILTDPAMRGPARTVLERELSEIRFSRGDVGTQLAHQYWLVDARLQQIRAEILGGTDPESELGRRRLRHHALAPQYRALERQRLALHQMYRVRQQRNLPTSAQRVTASFVSDRGQAINLLIEAANVTPERQTRAQYWFVSDVTTPNSGSHTGIGANKVEAIQAALRRILQSGAGYGRGHLSVVIDGAAYPMRIESNSDELLMEALENVATIASVAAIAAAPFTGGSSLYLLIPIGIIGAIPSAYRIAQRVDNETFRWNLQTAMDVVNIVGSVIGGGQVAAGFRAASLAARGSTQALRAYRLSGALMITGFGVDGLGIMMMGAGIVQQLEATSELPEGLRQARIAEILGNAMLQAGILVGGTIASHQYQGRLQRGIEESRSPFGSWFDGLDQATQSRLRSEPRLMEGYATMRPDIRQLLTRCGSFCVPVDLPDAAMQQRLGRVVDRLRPTADDRRYLQAYFHERRSDLASAITALEAYQSPQAMRAQLTSTVSVADAVLLGFSANAQVTRGPAAVALINRIVATGNVGVAQLGTIMDNVRARRLYGQQAIRILDYIERLVSTAKPGHERVLADLERGFNFFTGAEFVLRYLTDNNLWGAVTRFEVTPAGGGRRWDAEIAGTLIQFKNWSVFWTDTFLRQFANDYTLTGGFQQQPLRWVFDGRLGTRAEIERMAINAINHAASQRPPRTGYSDPAVVQAMLQAIAWGNTFIVH